MELFLAIDLPTSSKRLIESAVEELKKEYSGDNWVDWQNYHITIYFFGEIKDPTKIIKKINNAIYDQGIFYLYSSNTDIFISKKIIMYLSFNREKKLEILVKKIKESFASNDKNKYVLHLTLARGRIPSKQQYLLLKKKLNNLDIDVSFPVKKIILFETYINQGKPIYRIVKKFPLMDFK